MSRRFLILAVLAAALSPPSRADTSVVPYTALYESLRPALEVSGHDRLVARTRILSKRGDVAPEQIRLDIQSRSGVRSVRVAANGDVQFPLDEGLRGEALAAAMKRRYPGHRGEHFQLQMTAQNPAFGQPAR